MNDEMMHALQVALSIVFSYLWVERHFKVGTELAAYTLNLHRNASCCIHGRVEEDVEQHIQSLGVAHNRQFSGDCPTCIGRYFSKQFLVVLCLSPCFLKVLLAIKIIEEPV